jgi:ubiquinone/menaquinone biosynthesis C-methylase UbiE
MHAELEAMSGQSAHQFISKNPHFLPKYHELYEVMQKRWGSDIPWRKAVEVLCGELCKEGPPLEIADLGCGPLTKVANALSRNVRSFRSKYTVCLPLICANTRKIYNFDHEDFGNKTIQVCNLAKLQQPSYSLDIAIFSLSLMGTDWRSYLSEAFRALKSGGKVLIFETLKKVGKHEVFTKLLTDIGFCQVSHSAPFFKFVQVTACKPSHHVIDFGP